MNLEEFAQASVPSQLLMMMKRQGTLPIEIHRLVNCPQSPEAHPEGDVFNHICHVVDAMATICQQEGISGDRRRVLMLAALLHDVGKPDTTEFNLEKNRITSHSHDEKGVPIAFRFLSKYPLSFDKNIRENISSVLAITRYHMYRCNKEFSNRAIRRLARRMYPCTIRDLILMFRADCAGRPPLPAELSREVLDQFIPRAIEIGVMDSPGVLPEDRPTLLGDSHASEQQIDEQSSRNETISS